MIHIVIWSGGYDSTLILDRLCASRDKTVWAFSLEWNMINDRKTHQEKKVRKRYKKYAKKKGYKFYHRTIKVGADMGAPTHGLPQALAWFCFVLPYLPQESKVYLGYHRGDDFWRYHDHVGAFFREGQLIGKRNASIEYPLELDSKWEIVEDCRKRGIPSSCIWTCENPKKKNKKIVSCGKCNPCINLKLAGYEQDLRSKG